jgi:adenylate cyclase
MTIIFPCGILAFLQNARCSSASASRGGILAFLFGDMTLDGVRRELRSGSALLSIEPQVFDLLEFLVTNRHRVVSRDDLLAAVWNGRIVSDSAIDARINAARRAIGDDGQQQRWIRTIARKGFRFVGDVREEPGAAALSVRASSVQSKPSIAVLPFANMSGDPEQEYFSDGITEDIITDLSKISTLSVVPRATVFTFKGKSIDISQVAQRLKVGHVVEGSVRKASGRVRITAQLIDATKDSHVWAERYDRELNDIFALQDEISQAIVAALKVRLLPEERLAIEKRSTDDPKAYQLYLMGRHYYLRFSARNLEIAIRFGQRALEIDPDYARARALVASCQHFLHRSGRSEDSGLSAAEKAISLDPTLAEPHATKGRLLAEMGCYDAALAAHEESLLLEPDSFDVRHNFGLTCMELGRDESAIEHFERAAQLLETDYTALCFAATRYKVLGRHDELQSAARRALERIEREIALRPDNATALAFGSLALAYLEEKERAMEWASRALIIEPDDAMDRYNLACAFAQIDEPDQALDLLESYLRKAPPDHLGWITQDSDLLPLHDHPRFQTLVAREEARLAAAQPEQVGR